MHSVARQLNRQFFAKGLASPGPSFRFSSVVQPIPESQDPVLSSMEGVQTAVDIHANQKIASFFDHFRVQEHSLDPNAQISDMDLGNLTGSLAPLRDYTPRDVISKFSTISPGHIYEVLDEFSREALFQLANTQGLGMGLGILGVTVAIKAIFTPIQLAAQLNTIKMKLLEPEQKANQSAIQGFQKQQDWVGLKRAQAQFSALRKRHGINNSIILLSLLQMPVLMTWFFSLRQVAGMPDKFPGVTNEGLLWFKDLSLPDPYYIMPIVSAALTSLNIQQSATTQQGGTIFSRQARQMKFFPFASIPVAVFFPAAINVYWCLSAFIQLWVTLIGRSQAFRRLMGVPEQLPGTVLERLNQKHTQRVVKTVVQDVPRNKIIEEAKVSAANLKHERTEERSEGGAAHKSEARVVQKNEAKVEPVAASGKAKVVYTNKPSKKKH